MRQAALNNARAYRWLHGALFAVLLWAVLNSLSFSPYAAIPFLVLATGAAALVAPALAVAVTIALITMPLLAADLVTGVVFLLLAVVLFPFLSRRSGSVFLVLAYGVLLAYAGPVWTVVALAGLLLGASEGAALAALTCVTVQFAARLAGATHAGMVASGATSAGIPLLAGGPADMLDLTWLEGAFETAGSGVFLGLLPDSGSIPLLVLQPLAWATGAAVTGALLRPVGSPHRKVSALAAAAAGVCAAAAAHLIVLGAYGALPPAGAAAALALSLAGALLFAGVREWVFSPVLAARRAPRPTAVHKEADIDQLLRLIATDDALPDEHATTATVLITDVQSFSALTESAGSLASARVIQHQRGLLMPVIERLGGRCKSTGGDGLVAAFPEPAAAVRAAAEMQQTLARHNSSEDREHEVMIRTGIATGELVLDRGGRPFIGSAVNLAARIMDLADGGQVLVSADVAVAARAADIPVAPRGPFELKNIEEPVQVAEVLWGQVEPEVDGVTGGSTALRGFARPARTKAPA